jgi:hypothetical protein
MTMTYTGYYNSTTAASTNTYSSYGAWTGNGSGGGTSSYAFPKYSDNRQRLMQDVALRIQEKLKEMNRNDNRKSITKSLDK